MNNTDEPKPIQDHMPAELAVCYGCGHANPHEMGIRTRWDGRQGICLFTPPPDQLAYPGVVYGGLLACVIDCHCIGTACAEAHHALGQDPAGAGPIVFVTGNLNVDFLNPTPMGPELELVARVVEKTERKSLVECEVMVQGLVTARGRVLAVRSPVPEQNAGL